MSQAREYVGTVVGEGGAELPVWYEPTADDWADYEQYLSEQPEQLPTPEDFGPTPERAAEILAECGGLPF